MTFACSGMDSEPEFARREIGASWRGASINRSACLRTLLPAPSVQSRPAMLQSERCIAAPKTLPSQRRGSRVLGGRDSMLADSLGARLLMPLQPAMVDSVASKNQPTQSAQPTSEGSTHIQREADDAEESKQEQSEAKDQTLVSSSFNTAAVLLFAALAPVRPHSYERIASRMAPANESRASDADGRAWDAASMHNVDPGSLYFCALSLCKISPKQQHAVLFARYTKLTRSAPAR